MAYIVIILTKEMQTIVIEKGVTMFHMSEIGKRIKALRESRELTQQSVATECGVSRVAVTKWENGDTGNLKFSNITSLLRLFNISYDELTTGKTTPQSEKAKILIDSLKREEEKDFVLHVVRVAVSKIKQGISGETQIPQIAIDQEFDKDSH